MTQLELLVENFSKYQGREYLMTSQPSTSRAFTPDTSTPCSKTVQESPRIFPLRPKEDNALIQIWFKFILPALPQILSESLGGTYAASLVLRGRNGAVAEPCIQVGCRCLPRLPNQKIIKNSISEVCRKNGHGPISMHFTEGRVRKLNGVEGEDDDNSKGIADHQRLELNYGRPYSKPGMGASVGLLCSKKVSATLGGCVLIDGDKFLLTSDHFVSTSREQVDRDYNSSDFRTLTSPSPCDLNRIKNNLKQTMLDLNNEINLLMRSIFGDRDLSEDFFSESNISSPDLRDMIRRKSDITSLLDQVRKEPSEYAVGTVKKVSSERKSEALPRCLAEKVGLQTGQLTIMHQMDWALVMTNIKTAQTCENRHKYRSDQDAMQDDYIDEKDHISQPGDVCHETCAVEPGLSVHYVGQKSRHRSGKVHIPTLVSHNHSVTHEWGISAADGHQIPYSDVAGDSGPWVILEDGNRLMGQVHSYGFGRVYFTPIDVVFADIRDVCGSDVCLPPCPSDLREIACPTPVDPLCSILQTPLVESYKYLKPAPVASATPLEESPATTGLSEKMPRESLSKTNSPSDDENADFKASLDPRCDSPRSLPVDSPQYSVTTPDNPKSLCSSGDVGMIDEQLATEEVPSENLTTMVGESAMSEIPDLSLDEQGKNKPRVPNSYAFQLKSQPPSQINSNIYSRTWPVSYVDRVTRARLGSRPPQLRKSRDHAVFFLARSVLDSFARLPRKIGKCL